MAPAWAQTVRTYDIPYPDAYVTGAAQGLVLGRFDADLSGSPFGLNEQVIDGALLNGGNLFLMDSLDRQVSFQKLTGPFFSIATVDLSFSFAPQGILATTTTGVALITWDPSNESLMVTTQITDPDWAQATHLQVVQRAGGSACVRALSSSGMKLLHGTWSGTSLTAGTPASIAAPALTMAAAFWDGDTSADFAYDSGSGLRVVNVSGFLLASSNRVDAEPQLARMPWSGADDSLAWLTSDPANPGYQALLMIRRGAGKVPVVDQTTACYPDRLERLTPSSFDSLAGVDLVVSLLNSTGDRIAREYQRTGQGTLAGGAWEQSIGSVWGTCSEAPIVVAGDVDGDTDEDLLFAGHKTCIPGLSLFFGGTVNEHWPASVCGNPPSSFDGHLKAWVMSANYSNSSSHPDILIDFWPPPTIGPAAGATHWFVRVIEGSELGRADGDILYETVIPLAPTGSVTIPPLGVDGLHFQLCYVTMSGGKVVQAFPGWSSRFRGGPGGGTDTTGGFNPPPQPPAQSNP